MNYRFPLSERRLMTELIRMVVNSQLHELGYSAEEAFEFQGWKSPLEPCPRRAVMHDPDHWTSEMRPTDG